MLANFRCEEPREVPDVKNLPLQTIKSYIAVETGQNSGHTAGARTRAKEKQKRVNLSAMELLSDKVSDFTTYLVSAMGTRSSNEEEDNHRYKNLQHLDLVLRIQRALTESTAPRIVKCLSDEAETYFFVGCRITSDRNRSPKQPRFGYLTSFFVF